MSGAEMAMTPLQQWGEEVEDGVIYSIVLQRVRKEHVASSPLDDHSTPECSFVQYRTCKRRVLRAATLPRLVEWLVTANAEGDLDYVSSFLATYQAFATPMQVLELLLPPLGPDKKVPHVLEFWLQHHPEDFWEPPRHPSLQKVLHFLYQTAPDSHACALAEELLQAHEEGEREERGRGTTEAVGGKSPRMGLSQVIREATGAGSYEEALALLSFPVDEVAEQLTLIDADLFRAVRPFHCLGCVWSQRLKKENQHVSPSVRATVAQFNAVTSCVIASVLGDLTLRTAQRAHLLEKWIAIAQRCRALRNFSSLHAILSALQSNSIYRLKRTWAAVNRDTRGIFRKLSQIFSEDNNHLNCREILLQGGSMQDPCDGSKSPQMPPGVSLEMRSQSRLVAPTIPYLGTFLTDLIMLDTALPDFVEGNLINFEKRRKEGAILSQIQQLQESCKGYNISPNPSFHVAFHHHQQLSEEQSYRISRVIEPPADSCPTSPKLHRSLTKRFSSLLLGSEVSTTLPSLDKSRNSPMGSCSSLNSEDGSSTPPLPASGPPTIKNLPVPQPRTRPPLALPLPSSISTERGTESRIIRVSMNSEHGNGNCYRSIVITSQDRTTAVVERALQKHNLEGDSPQSYQLLQLLGDGQELLIPDNANAFYAMKPTGSHDFLLCPKKGGSSSPGLGTIQPTTNPILSSTPTFKDCSKRALIATSGLLYPHALHLVTHGPAPVYPSSSEVHSQLRPASFLHSPPFPAPPTWILGAEPPSSFPPPSLPLPHHQLTQKPFGSAPDHPLQPSPLQRLTAPASGPQSPLCHSLGAALWSGSPQHCAVHHLPAPQGPTAPDGPRALLHSSMKVDPQSQS